MASPNDVPMDEGDDIHKPFTVEENIRQLNDIDKSIAQLMDHTATALHAVSIPISSPSSTDQSGESRPEANPTSQKEALHTATDSFLDTLHKVDVMMKRQIMALEEAGIVNLAPAQKQEPGSTATKTSLKPNGMGSVGTLDVGWLNSQGSKVEREMEVELWSRAKEFLEKDKDNIKIG